MQLAGTFIPVAEITSASQIWGINTNNHKPNRKCLSTFLQKHSLINLAFLQKHSLINYLRMEAYHQLKNFYFLKGFTLLFIHFVQKHSFTEFKNFFCLNSCLTALCFCWHIKKGCRFIWRCTVFCRKVYTELWSSQGKCLLQAISSLSNTQ